METSIHSAPVTQALGEKIDFFITERLRPSSKSTISTAVTKHWLPFTEAHGLPEFIPSGHYRRGSIMAGFVATLVSLGLVFSTISGYVWGIVDHHLTNHYASPIANVRDWGSFMSAVQVQSFVPAQPRKMLPFELFLKILVAIDRSVFDEVCLGTILLTEFYTISRGELIPTAQTGNNGFADNKNATTADYRTSNGYLEFCIKAKKQDPLAQRKTAYLGKEWIPIGECKGAMDLAGWLGLYVSFSPSSTHNLAGDPLFVTSKGTYATQPWANSLLRTLIRRVGLPEEEAVKFSLAGVRVVSMNVHSVSPAGQRRVDRNWKSNAKHLYSRQELDEQLSLASNVYNMGRSRDIALSPMEQFDNPTFHAFLREDAPTNATTVAIASPPPSSPLPPPSTPSPPQERPAYTTNTYHCKNGRVAKTYTYNNITFSSKKRLYEALGAHDTSIGIHNPSMAPSPFAQAASNRREDHTLVASEFAVVRSWVGTAHVGANGPRKPVEHEVGGRAFSAVIRTWKQVVECRRRIHEYEDDYYKIGGDDIMGADTSMAHTPHMASSADALTNLYTRLQQYQVDLEQAAGYVSEERPKRRRL
jgi:hypothetical protein